VLADLSRLRVRAWVDEADYAGLRAGQRVAVTSEAVPGRTFRGVVTSIGLSAGPKRHFSGEARERVDVTVVDVLIALEEAAPLRPGVRVTAFFELDDGAR
jgi:multidrug resistance efflux pump